MLKFKALYKTMYDDLKDSDMLIDYALELKDEAPTIAKELVAYARERMSHFKKFHDLFQTTVKKWKEEEKNSEAAKMVENCLWSTTHEHLQDWAKSIEEKIASY